MAVTIGELAVEFEARTREFRAAMGQVQNQIDRFEKNANKATASAGRSFQGLGKIIAWVGGVMIAAFSVKAMVNFGVESIQTAAKFEKFGVILQNFLGTQEEATKAVEEFTEIAARTPFAVADVVQAGATLGGLALANREALKSLTQQAINLAAVTGLSLPEAAGNLQKALSAGIAAADLFRERGVRKLIESVAGIPDMTKLPLEEQRRLFEELFGTGGIFGQAAENLSYTLGGAISNLGDAAERLKASFGDALGPATIAGLREFLIPFLDRLRELIDKNKAAILDFAFRGVKAATGAFAGMIRAGAFLLRSLGTVQKMWQGLQLTILEVATQIAKDLNFLRIVSDDTVKEMEGTLNIARQELTGETIFDDMADAADKVVGQMNELEASIKAIDIKQYTQEIKEATKSSEELRKALEASREKPPLDPETAKKAERGLTQLKKAAERVREANIKAQEPLLLQIRNLNETITANRGLLELEQYREEAAKNLTVIEKERDKLIEKLSKSRYEETSLTLDLEKKLHALARVDQDRADSVRRTVEREIEAAAGTEARTKAIQKAMDDVDDALTDAGKAQQEKLATAISGGLQAGIRGFISGGFAGFGEALAEAASSSLEERLSTTLETLAKEASNLFSTALKGLGLGGQVGDMLGAAGSLIGAFVGSALQKTGARQTYAAVSSAVQSTQATRGIVVGPTSMGIAQVERGIVNGFVEPTKELRIHTRLLERIARSLGAGGVAGSVSQDEEAERILSTTSAALA